MRIEACSWMGNGGDMLQEEGRVCPGGLGQSPAKWSWRLWRRRLARSGIGAPNDSLHKTERESPPPSTGASYALSRATLPDHPPLCLFSHVSPSVSSPRDHASKPDAVGWRVGKTLLPPESHRAERTGLTSAGTRELVRDTLYHET